MWSLTLTSKELALLLLLLDWRPTADGSSGSESSQSDSSPSFLTCFDLVSLTVVAVAVFLSGLRFNIEWLSVVFDRWTGPRLT